MADGAPACQIGGVSVRRETRRLSRVFGALVLALGPAVAAQACSDASAVDPTTDAKPAEDGARDDGSADGYVKPIDAARPKPDAFCDMLSEMIDAGPEAAADADIGCRYTLPCGLPEGGGFELVGCGFYRADASLGCQVPEGKGCMADVYVPLASGSVTIECLDCFGGGGRRPVGLRRAKRTRARTALGAYFARMAHDEHASVHAFVAMQGDLARFGGPAALIEAAARSARDEARHARMMARQARIHGGVVPSPRLRRTAPRTLEAIALENAVEGCVNETYGALQMRFQAAHAQDASLRRLFARIAADETRHAALSWMVASWAESRLDAGARRRVAAARSRAARALRAKLSEPSRPAFDGVVGRPSREHALTLLDGMLESLA